MIDWITTLIDDSGPLGVALLMFLENVFPPIPSELIMPLAGFNAAMGRMSLVAVIIAGTLGSLAGALVWYWVGRFIGAERIRHVAARHGRWITVSPRDVDAAQAWFDRHGTKAVLLGRLVPAVRTLISIPAGLAHMPLLPFIIWSAIGSLFWTTFLTLSGYFLRDAYEKVEVWVDPLSTVVVVVVVAIWLWRVITWRNHP